MLTYLLYRLNKKEASTLFPVAAIYTTTADLTIIATIITLIIKQL